LCPDVQIDLWSDVVCPWCYVGKARIEAAAAEVAAEGIEVTVTYRAYQLDPAAPAEGTPLGPYLARKYGNPDALAAMSARLDEAAAELPIDFRWDGIVRRRTVDAHRLLAWALDQGGPTAQGRLKDRLLRAYFTEHLDVADHGVLARLASEVDLPGDLAADALATGWGADRVDADQAEAHERGIAAVPSAVIEGEWLLQGAHPVASWTRAFRHIATELATR
jgi:predicted DsbA family dithiol-disulfide isomerase